MRVTGRARVTPVVKRESFGRDLRLLRRSDFDAVFRPPNARLRAPPLMAIARRGTAAKPRLGLVVGKRVLRRAVDRNRAKRLIREAFRVSATSLPELDVVVRVVDREPFALADAEALLCTLGARFEHIERKRRRSRGR